MAKNLKGDVRFDNRQKRGFFRCAPVDPKTGMRRERKGLFLTSGKLNKHVASFSASMNEPEQPSSHGKT